MSNADSNQIAGYGDLSLHWILVLLDLIRRRYSFMSERLILWLTCTYYNSVGGTYARNNAVGISQLESRWKPNELSKVYVSYIPVSISNALAARIWRWGNSLGPISSYEAKKKDIWCYFSFMWRQQLTSPILWLVLWPSGFQLICIKHYVRSNSSLRPGEFLGNPGIVIVIVIVIEGLDLGQKTLN